MKNYKINVLFTFLLANFLAFGYLNPLESTSRNEVLIIAKKKSELRRIAEIEKNMNYYYSFTDKPELTDKKLIIYQAPDSRYKSLGEHGLVEAIEYKYSDGTTCIVSYDGKILKNK